MNLAKNRTLKNLLEQSVEKYANRPALGRVDEETITYKQLGEKAQTFSKVLYECGIMQGDRVAILSENDPNWGIAFFAITTMGAVAVPILPDFIQMRYTIFYAIRKLKLSLFPKSSLPSWKT